MSKIFIITFSILISKMSFSQPPAAGADIYRPELDKFVGTWKFANDSEDVIFILKKVHNYSPLMQITEDELMGCHRYVKNGVIIEDYLADSSMLGKFCNGTLLLWQDFHHPDADSLNGNISDKLKRKRQNFTVKYVLGTYIRLICNIWGSGEGFVIAPSLPGITLPVDFILVKQ